MQVSFDFTSLIVNLIALIPVTVMALFVEKRGFTKFWPAFWNLVTLIGLGVSMIVIPQSGYVPGINFASFTIPMWGILFAFAGITLVLGFKADSDVIRTVGSSRITSSVLIMNLFAQSFRIIDPLYLGIICGVAYGGLYLVMKKGSGV